MREYDLGSEEGVLLMCVAEALLRIPDQDTADKLIRDKLGDADWKRARGPVRLGAGQRLDLGPDAHRPSGRPGRRHPARRRAAPSSAWSARVGEPVIRLAVRQAMRIMGHQFVMGRTIDEALDAFAQGRQRRATAIPSTCSAKAR